LNDTITFHEASEHFKKMFNLPLSNCGLKILHVSDTDNTRTVIDDESTFRTLVEEATKNELKVLRFDITLGIPSDAAPIETKVEKEPTRETVNILERPDVRKEMEKIVLETIQSPEFMDTVAKKLSMYIQRTTAVGKQQEVELSEDVLRKLESLKEPQERIIDLEIKKERKTSFSESLLGTLKKALLSSDHKPEPVVEEKPAVQEEKKEIVQEENNAHEEEAKSEEKPPVEEKLVEPKESSPPLFRSLLSVFKSFKKEQAPKEKEIPQEQLESMLKQLEDMGFADKEACTRALKFHHGFNEGLDAVVEDLLSQKEKEEKAKEDEAEEGCLSDDKRKGKQPMNVMSSFSEEDIENLMKHADIPREAAIKALESQL